MDSTILLAFLLQELDRKIDEKIISLRSSSRKVKIISRDPEPGPPGKDFDMAEHEATIKSWISENRLKFSDLTDDEIESLRGLPGKPGKPGASIKGDPGEPGAPGKDFSLDEHSDTIRSWIRECSLRFSDLTAEERLSLKGKDGKDGKDFSIEEQADNIKALLSEIFEEVKGSLKLKFSDLTDEEIAALKGDPGTPGKNGRSFVFEDHREEITDILANSVSACRDDFKLNFRDLTEDEKREISFKFSDFTPEQINALKIKGNRGQRGRRGEDGKDFDMSEHEAAIKSWIFDNRLKFSDLSPKERLALKGRNGIDGRNGKNGEDGSNGRDGKDAPRVVDIRLEEIGKEEFVFIFYFSDGSRIETNRLQIPKHIVNTTYIVGGGGGGSGPGPGSEVDIYWEGNLLGPASAINFEGDLELDYNDGNVNVKTVDQFILKNYTCDSDVFVGAIIHLYPTLTPVVMRKWVPLSIANPILFYEAGVQVGLVNPRVKSQSMPVGIVTSVNGDGTCNVRIGGMSLAYYTDLNPTLDYFVDPDAPGMPISEEDIVARAGNYWKTRFGYPGATNKFIISRGIREYVGV